MYLKIIPCDIFFIVIIVFDDTTARPKFRTVNSCSLARAPIEIWKCSYLTIGRIGRKRL